MPRTPSGGIGTVPDRLKVVIQREQEFTRTVDGKTETQKFRPAFFVDADDKMDVAIAWGRCWRNKKTGVIRYDCPYYGITRKQQEDWEVIESDIEVVENEQMGSLYFWEINERAQGGRAYRVYDGHGRIFDMREDIVVEAIVAKEFNGGIFNGKYVWVKCGSQLRIARHGSKLYESLLEAKVRKGMRKIPNKDLEVGKVYITKSGKEQVYLGRVKGKGMVIVPLNRWNYGSIPDERTHQELFENFCGGRMDYSEMHESYYCSSHSLVEEVGSVDLSGKILP